MLKQRLVNLSYFYIIPVIFSFIGALNKDIKINGVELSTVWNIVCHFIIGMAFEGFLLLIALTFAALSGKFD